MRNSRRCIVTGGCGFIGSALVRHLCREGREVLVVDKLTYAGTVESLKEVEGKYTLLVKDICDQEAMDAAGHDIPPGGRVARRPLHRRPRRIRQDERRRNGDIAAVRAQVLEDALRQGLVRVPAHLDG